SPSNFRQAPRISRAPPMRIPRSPKRCAKRQWPSTAGPCRCDNEKPRVIRGAFRGKASVAFMRRLASLELQVQSANAGGNVETVIAFDTDRLKGNRLIEAAEQHIRPDATTNRRARAHAAIAAFERARLHVRRGRDHIPNQHAAFGVADIDADL